MTISKAAYEAKTTYSKWQKGNIRRIYLNSPILRWYGVKFYYELGYGGYTRYVQIGTIANYNMDHILSKFWQYLVEKGIISQENLYLDLGDMFEEWWRKL